jgi:phosphatidylethanolamine-binding protein (PEBP) family uncharacterized protein
MEVFYNGKLLKDDQFLRVSETQTEPHITLNVDPNKLYTLVLYDPDAVSGTYIHWIKANITNNDMRTGNIIIPYKGPAPPPKTGKHHYIFNLYEQNGENKTGVLEEKVFELNNNNVLLKYLMENYKDKDNKCTILIKTLYNIGLLSGGF